MDYTIDLKAVYNLAKCIPQFVIDLNIVCPFDCYHHYVKLIVQKNAVKKIAMNLLKHEFIDKHLFVYL